MLFDFKSFIDELRENSEKKELIEKYEKFFGNIEGEIIDQIWYKDYVSTFAAIDYLVPEELKDDFNWILLMQLVASSLSSEGFLNIEEGKKIPEFTISVQSGDQLVIKKVSELWGFQILRLYEIYLEEQMNLQILISEDPKEKADIEASREKQFNRWKLVLDTLNKEQLLKQEKIEKEAKLSNLLDQL